MSERPLPGQVTGSLRALSTEIDRLDQAAADRYGLNRTDMRALDIVGRAGPLAPTALARLLGFTTGGVTTVLDRLERAGYVRRRPDPADRRRQVVEITDATAARDQEVFGDLIRGTNDLLATYTDTPNAANPACDTPPTNFRGDGSSTTGVTPTGATGGPYTV